MKIEQVKVILTSPNQNYLFVKLITDSGVYGVGDASLNGQEHTVADFITSFLTPILIGRDPTQIEDFWQLVYRGAYWRGGNIVMSALCGVDMALWDILGKVTGQPLYRLLGGKVRDKVLCYSHVLGKTNEEKAALAASYVKERGLKVIRLRAGAPAANGTLGGGVQDGPKVEPWTPEEKPSAIHTNAIRNLSGLMSDRENTAFDLMDELNGRAYVNSSKNAEAAGALARNQPTERLQLHHFFRPGGGHRDLFFRLEGMLPAGLGQFRARSDQNNGNRHPV